MPIQPPVVTSAYLKAPIVGAELDVPR
eukprot:COSAG02_NODE_32605_length_513_cov_1.611111_1_plen_26_part_10